MKIRVVYCDTCEDFSLTIDGKVVTVDYVVSQEFIREGHKGRAAEWDI